MAAIVVAVLYGASQLFVPQTEAMAGTIAAMNLAVVVPHYVPSFDQTQAWVRNYTSRALIGGDDIIIPFASLDSTLNTKLNIVEAATSSSPRRISSIIMNQFPGASSLLSTVYSPSAASTSASTMQLPTHSANFKYSSSHTTNGTLHSDKMSRHDPRQQGFKNPATWLTILTPFVPFLLFCVHGLLIERRPHGERIFSTLLGSWYAFVVGCITYFDAPFLFIQNFLSGWRLVSPFLNEAYRERFFSQCPWIQPTEEFFAARALCAILVGTLLSSVWIADATMRRTCTCDVRHEQHLHPFFKNLSVTTWQQIVFVQIIANILIFCYSSYVQDFSIVYAVELVAYTCHWLYIHQDLVKTFLSQTCAMSAAAIVQAVRNSLGNLRTLYDFLNRVRLWLVLYISIAVVIYWLKCLDNPLSSIKWGMSHKFSQQTHDNISTMAERFALVNASYYIAIGLVALIIFMFRELARSLWDLLVAHVQTTTMKSYHYIQHIWTTVTQFVVECYTRIVKGIAEGLSLFLDGIEYIFQSLGTGVSTGAASIVAGFLASKSLGRNVIFRFGPVVGIILERIMVALSSGFFVLWAIDFIGRLVHSDYEALPHISWDSRSATDNAQPAELWTNVAIHPAMVTGWNKIVVPSWTGVTMKGSETVQALPSTLEFYATSFKQFVAIFDQPWIIALGMLQNAPLHFMALVHQVGRVSPLTRIVITELRDKVSLALVWAWLSRALTIAILTAGPTIVCIVALRAWPQHKLHSAITVTTSLATPFMRNFAPAIRGFELIQDHFIVNITVIIILLSFWPRDSTPGEVPVVPTTQGDVETQPRTVPKPPTQQPDDLWDPFQNDLQDADQLRIDADQKDANIDIDTDVNSHASNNEREDPDVEQQEEEQSWKQWLRDFFRNCIPTPESLATDSQLESVETSAPEEVAVAAQHHLETDDINQETKNLLVSLHRSTDKATYIENLANRRTAVEQAVAPFHLNEPRNAEPEIISESEPREVLQDVPNVSPNQTALPEPEEPRNAEPVSNKPISREVLQDAPIVSPLQNSLPKPEEPGKSEALKIASSKPRDVVPATPSASNPQLFKPTWTPGPSMFPLPNMFERSAGRPSNVASVDSLPQFRDRLLGASDMLTQIRREAEARACKGGNGGLVTPSEPPKSCDGNQSSRNYNGSDTEPAPMRAPPSGASNDRLVPDDEDYKKKEEIEDKKMDIEPRPEDEDLTVAIEQTTSSATPSLSKAFRDGNLPGALTYVSSSPVNAPTTLTGVPSIPSDILASSQPTTPEDKQEKDEEGEEKAEKGNVPINAENVTSEGLNIPENNEDADSDALTEISEDELNVMGIEQNIERQNVEIKAQQLMSNEENTNDGRQGTSKVKADIDSSSDESDQEWEDVLIKTGDEKPQSNATQGSENTTRKESPTNEGETERIKAPGEDSQEAR